ncbi:HhH-GPD superfamily base excision DNA repair protein [Botrimarina colliarenosi]|uniref:DNA-(apurinic or apyrimidinic site) lyase n=1 Tax=Botrimarina colliarenosi TaxID=2528001 RepID=A0A5C6AMZ9_9BACT|nr:endonuclease III domain-containing protein [Botrimarina colliarenosi]TWU00382.1 HhH-GPD superfamily base excision DNA repair protein [Botrimarina colliarenosi]
MPRSSRLSIAVPADLWLPATVCSYGYFLLAPNRWLPTELALVRSFDAAEFGLPEERFSVHIDQPAGRGAPLRVRCDASVSAPARRAVRGAVVRMLRLEKDLTTLQRAFPGIKRRGFGRLFRSATLLEDMVKTITSCNVGWPSTVRMNQLLVDRVGGGAFPSAERLARWTPGRLQKVCRVGYRAKRIIRLARRFAKEDLDPAWFESPERSTEELREALLALDGFGPYSAANVLQLLDHDDELPIDTETHRLYCKRQGVERPANPLTLHPAIVAHYERYRPHRFLAYWFELWRDYESQRGDAWTWDTETVGSSFTASQLD